MSEHRADHIARRPIFELIIFPNASGGVVLQFTHGQCHGFVMRLDDAFVIAHECRDGN